MLLGVASEVQSRRQLFTGTQGKYEIGYYWEKEGINKRLRLSARATPTDTICVGTGYVDPIWAGTKDVKPIAMDRDHARPIQADWAHVRALTYILIGECGLIELTRAPS